MPSKDAATATRRTSTLLTVDEHAAREKTPPAIAAAVLQFAGWSSGKKITKKAFKDAVNAFLNAPMGGMK